MEPVSIISLIFAIGAFLKDCRDSGDREDEITIRNLIDYLRREEHQQLLNVIETDRRLHEATQSLLKNGVDRVQNQLDGLDETLAIVLQNTRDWAGIAASVLPNAGLSDQSISILMKFQETGAAKATKCRSRRGYSLDFHSRPSTELEIQDEQFFEDDLNQLVMRGLLLHETTFDERDIYTITRAGIRVVENRAKREHLQITECVHGAAEAPKH